MGTGTGTMYGFPEEEGAEGGEDDVGETLALLLPAGADEVAPDVADFLPPGELASNELNHFFTLGLLGLFSLSSSRA